MYLFHPSVMFWRIGQYLFTAIAKLRKNSHLTYEQTCVAFCSKDSTVWGMLLLQLYVMDYENIY